MSARLADVLLSSERLSASNTRPSGGWSTAASYRDYVKLYSHNKDWGGETEARPVIGELAVKSKCGAFHRHMKKAQP